MILGKLWMFAKGEWRKIKKRARKRLPAPILYDDRTNLTWEEAVTQTSGYHAEPIIEKVRLAALEVTEGRASYDRDGTVFQLPDYNWPLLALCGIAGSLNEGRLEVLDFGGSLGTAYLQHREFLTKMPFVDWRIVEQDHFVELGRSEVIQRGLGFFSSIEEASKGFRPSISYLGSSLQYVENPSELLRKIEALTKQFLVLDRIPLHPSESRLLKQMVPSQIYKASYPMRVLSQQEIQDTLSDRWTLISSFECIGGSAKTISGLEFQWRGLVFTRASIDATEFEGSSGRSLRESYDP